MKNIRITFPKIRNIQGFAIIETKYLDSVQIFDFFLPLRRGTIAVTWMPRLTNSQANRSGGSTKPAIFSPGKDLN